MLPDGFTFHYLRKTFLTHLIQHTGGNIGAGQMRAGHSTPVVIATYYLGKDMAFLAEAVEGLRLVQPASTPEHTASTPRLRVVSPVVGNRQNGL